jgi:hypothetical protein
MPDDRLLSIVAAAIVSEQMLGNDLNAAARLSRARAVGAGRLSRNREDRDVIGHSSVTASPHG